MTKRRCCCGEGGCCADYFEFDFEFIRQTGSGGSTSVVAQSGACTAADEDDSEGTSLIKVEGTARFNCGASGWTWDSSNSSASFDPNVDQGASRPSWRWLRLPSIPNRCTTTDCIVCDEEQINSWVVTNDTTDLTDGSAGIYTTLPGFFASCPGLPTTPTNGFYRIVWLEVEVDADKATRTTVTYTPHNGGSCPSDTDTTGTATNVTSTQRFAYIWDCSGWCDEGTLVKAFTWQDLTYNCVDLLPEDNTFTVGPTVTDTFCPVGTPGCLCSSAGGELLFTETTYAYLFDLTDATYSNWTTSP